MQESKLDQCSSLFAWVSISYSLFVTLYFFCHGGHLSYHAKVPQFFLSLCNNYLRSIIYTLLCNYAMMTFCLDKVARVPKFD